MKTEYRKTKTQVVYIRASSAGKIDSERGRYTRKVMAFCKAYSGDYSRND